MRYIRIMLLDVQQLEAARLCAYHMPVHRPFQLLRIDDYQKYFSPAKMYGVHFQDDRCLDGFFTVHMVIF